MIVGLVGLLAVGFLMFRNQEVLTPMTPKNWHQYDGIFRQYGTIYGVNWQHLKAISLNESNLGRAPSVALGLIDPGNIQGSKSSDGKSWGLMQVTLTTAKSLDPLATERKLNDPNYSVQLAARYISELKKMFKTSDPRFLEWVIKSYNQGPGNTKKEIQSGKGYADEYWERFKQNLRKVEATP